jgi:protein ImuA
MRTYPDAYRDESEHSPPDAARQRARLAALRSEVQAIERRSPTPGRSALQGMAAWGFGAADLDAWIGGGLETGALHEVRPAAASAAAWASAEAFALALGRRRLVMLEGAGRHASAPILWVAPAVLGGEHGLPYGPGLATLGLDPARLLLVAPRRMSDALWAMEEGLKSASLALVVGLLGEAIALTPARRLALAAAAHGTPCLAVTTPRASVTPATATRWRIAPSPSRPPPFDAAAPGAALFTIALERCRARPRAAEMPAMSLEWSDEACRFRLVCEFQHRPALSRRAARRAG